MPPRVERRPFCSTSCTEDSGHTREEAVAGGCANTHGRRNRCDVPRGRALPPRVEHQHSAAPAASHHDSTGRALPTPEVFPACILQMELLRGGVLTPMDEDAAGAFTRSLILVTVKRPKIKGGDRRQYVYCQTVVLPAEIMRSTEIRSSDETRCQTG